MGSYLVVPVSILTVQPSAKNTEGDLGIVRYNNPDVIIKARMTFFRTRKDRKDLTLNLLFLTKEQICLSKQNFESKITSRSNLIQSVGQNPELPRRINWS